MLVWVRCDASARASIRSVYTHGRRPRRAVRMATHAEGPSCGLIMTGMRGGLVGAGHPDLSLTRFSDVKTFNMLFFI